MCLGRSESWKREQSRSEFSPPFLPADSPQPHRYVRVQCDELTVCPARPMHGHMQSQMLRRDTAVLQLRRDTYSRLTPVQRLQVARHPNRPTFLDVALNISDK